MGAWTRVQLLGAGWIQELLECRMGKTCLLNGIFSAYYYF